MFCFVLVNMKQIWLEQFKDWGEERSAQGWLRDSRCVEKLWRQFGKRGFLLTLQAPSLFEKPQSTIHSKF